MIIIERFEGDKAVLENGGTARPTVIDRSLLPENAREGDVIEPEPISGSYTVNAEKTAERRAAAVRRLRKMGL